MVLLKMLLEIALLKMGELLVMMMTMISTSGREVPPAESLSRRQKCSCPCSASRRRCSVLKVHSLFFLGQNDLYTRRWAPELGLGEHNPLGRKWVPWCAQVGSAHLVGPLWYLFAPTFFIYSIKILHEVSACLELCRIGSMT